MIIIMRFGEDTVLVPKYIDIYIYQFPSLVEGGALHGPPNIFFLLFIKIEKVQ